MSDIEETVAIAAPADDDSELSEQDYEHDIEEDDDEDAAAVAAVDVDTEAEVVAEEVDAEEGLLAVPVEAEEVIEEDDPPILSTPKPKKKKSKKPASTGKKVKAQQPSTKKSKKSAGSRRHSADAGIPGERLVAADAARNMLLTAVPRLPVSVNENYTVRNLGQLHVRRKGKNPYATRDNLYPVGFCCDRLEFSPVHGRVLKMRCAIVDGRRANLDYSGPIFRVMWGQGVDEDQDKVKYPYNPYVNSAPITDGDDVLAVPMGSKSGGLRQGAPTPGMRVKVRFDKTSSFFGTVEHVKTESEKQGSKKSSHPQIVTIRYDDGFTEKLEFPDPDISLVMPGIDDEVDSSGNVELSYLNGKPVTSTIGRTPLEAWSNCLLKLGLIDEIILDMGMEVAKTSKEAEKVAKKNEKSPQKPRSMSEDYSSGPGIQSENGDINATPSNLDKNQEQGDEEDSEPISEEEQELREKVAALRAQLASAKKEDDAAAVELADIRIKLLGQFYSNPFGVSDAEKAHQASWIAAAVRKEKTKMGSTGNKRKIVTAADLLDRNNTFYDPEVEALLEGLPGSEYCTSYEYQANRGAVLASSKWLQEQKTLHEKEAKKKAKANKEAKAKASLDKEREMKRKRREDERDAKKRQKLEEEEEKKKSRIEERLKKLDGQINDRLFKEATFQREKVILLLAKNLSKEFTRRRKTAETLAREVIDETKTLSNVQVQDLPPLAKEYDEDIVRIWDFVSTFGDFFLDRGFMQKLPKLDELQTALDTLRGSETAMDKAEATAFVTDLAVSLCKPLSAGVTRTLFASLIALYPALQKDFGAAFFNGVNATKTKEDDEKPSHAGLLLPVDSFTWKEVARMAFEEDALGELGYQRQDAAHLIRGYRSAGHPNSKEARRIRRVEDHYIAILRQTLGERHLDPNDAVTATNTVRIQVPASNPVDKDNFLFYLHNINSMWKPLKQDALLQNITNAIDLAKKETGGDAKGIIDKLEPLASRLSKESEPQNLEIAKETVTKILEEKTEEMFSGRSNGERVVKNENDFTDKAGLNALQRLLDSKLYRCRMGELKNLELSPKELKELTRIREEYMSDALRLKEEMKRQELKESGDGDDDDDDFDEDDDDDRVKTSNGENGNAGDSKVETKGMNEAKSEATSDEAKSEIREGWIGKETPYDEFCADIPEAPELIRRCLAVLRTLSQSGPAEPFIYPVDPQTNPGYYDMLLRPMCMREAGTQLQQAAAEYQNVPDSDKEVFVEQVVVNFARNIRLIGRNCLSYANAGPMIIAAGGEMLRIFERLLLDWVLAPEPHLAPLDSLDDDLCVDPHPSDLESTVLLCDGCEGNFNVSRLDPPMAEIPKGDWYCPRCLAGRWWGDLDPRLGKEVTLSGYAGGKGRISRCLFAHAEKEGESSSLMYEVEMNSGINERVSLDEIDAALQQAGTPAPKIRCRVAVAESKGYGSGVDHGRRQDLVPVLLNPKVSDAAAQVALSSSVFRDSIAAASTLLINDSEEMTANEWLRLLALLIMKCSSSDVMQNVASEMEEKAAERLAKRMEVISQTTKIAEVLPKIDDGAADDVSSTDATETNGKDCAMEEKVALSGDVDAVEIPSNGEVGSEPVVVEASAFEAQAMQVDDVPSQAKVAHVEAEVRPSEEEESKAKRKAALAEKGRRQKAREDSIAAFCIKNQIRSTVASFEQDNVSQVVESALTTKDPGLAFSATRCRGISCAFCSLLDTSLGTNLVRVPNSIEWGELIKYGIRSRRTNMIAEVPGESFKRNGGKKLMAVSVRLDDELVAGEKSDLEFEQTQDGGMLEFLPRNPEAFQAELQFRYDSGLPFVTGSLSGHECCAAAVHTARKVQIVQEHKERMSALAEREEGNTCGRTLELCRDSGDRSYWAFNSEPDALFVCSKAGKWSKYSEPETIASVMVSLGKDTALQDLKRAFPNAHALVKNGRWRDLLLKRHFKIRTISQVNDDSSAAMEMESDTENMEDSFEEKDLVLVESKCGSQLWDATIRAVARNTKDKVSGYRVHYEGWSSRFDEWVSHERVVEASEDNRELQETMRKDVSISHNGLPAALESMEAISYLHARDRVRGPLPLPDFGKIAHAGPNSSEDEKIFALMKAAVLVIEAALPIGSVNNLPRGYWSPAQSSQWRIMVQNALGPWNLMRCVIFLEDAISEEWIKEQAGNLRSCLPSRWKALEDACSSSLALRIFLLDRALMYGTVDKRKYRQRTKK